jgi:hypothetical protein
MLKNPANLSQFSAFFLYFIAERCTISIDLFGGANLFNAFPWRGDRVADCASLERMCTGNGTEGSNPSLSAIWAKPNTLSGAAGARDENLFDVRSECNWRWGAGGGRAAIRQSRTNPSLSAIWAKPN